MPDMIPVKSSNIESVGYNVETHTLYVKFLNGGTYIYNEVPPKEFDNLMSAESIGSYLNKNIKNVYQQARG